MEDLNIDGPASESVMIGTRWDNIVVSWERRSGGGMKADVMSSR